MEVVLSHSQVLVHIINNNAYNNVFDIFWALSLSLSVPSLEYFLKEQQRTLLALQYNQF